MIEVTDNWDTAAKKWAAIDAQRAFRTVMAEIGPLVRTRLREKAPVAKVNGGRFKNTIRSRPIFAGSTAKIEFYSNLPYAQYIINDTTPHLIKARRARALYWPSASHPTFKVNHPGTRANDFAHKVGEEMKEELEMLFTEKFRALFSL